MTLLWQQCVSPPRNKNGPSCTHRKYGTEWNTPHLGLRVPPDDALEAGLLAEAGVDPRRLHSHLGRICNGRTHWTTLTDGTNGGKGRPDERFITGEKAAHPRLCFAYFHRSYLVLFYYTLPRLSLTCFQMGSRSLWREEEMGREEGGRFFYPPMGERPFLSKELRRRRPTFPNTLLLLLYLFST